MDFQVLDRLYKKIFNSISDMIFIMESVEGEHFKYVAANEVAMEHANLKDKDYYGKYLEDMLPEKLAMELNAHYKKALSLDEPYVYEDYVQARNHNFYGESKLTTYYDDVEGKTYVLSITRDITLRKLSEEKLRKLAYEDFLTGLANRKVFEDTLEKSLLSVRGNNNASSVAVLLLDIDHFKQVNDKYGHEAGDQLLKKIAQTLKECVKNGEVVARIGGDEFAIVLIVESVQEAKEVAEKILKKSKDSIAVYNEKFDYTLSIGIAINGENDTRGKIIKKHADDALYEAKEYGRNQYKVYN
jgi:diguanylate cyclase